ncbi:MAG: 50S ribosomal protein L10 [Candidatus Wildermuthbacteria bacterium GWA2_46_15]|uniref:Large ribosomal subunit protein uL10 n=1 Tax=Candidatus Wildermuthbacteria bacterium GWA2_46_15 TaxID=1802443 RepID=A0A1G2QMG7_9BACT|nr:MAG: 50S ribosomal protein L10 [Candidatus Wildermuthbacteria bacterium GWA2_46_15]
MPKSKLQKQKTVEELKENLKKAKSVVFTDIQGIKAKDLVALRRKVKEAQGNLKVAKKTLIDLALEGTEKSPQAKEMNGEVAVLFAFEDPIRTLKSLYEFSRTHESLKFISGIFDGLLVGKDELLALAQLPPKEELLAKLVRSLASPMSGLINTFQGNIKGLITVLAKAKT